MTQVVTRLALMVWLVLPFVADVQAADISPPSSDVFQGLVNDAHAKFKDLKEGKNADYIPYLAKVDPNLYGIAIVTVDGKVYELGDTKFEFGIQSISKVFTLAMALEELGSDVIKDSIGVNATGLPFNSVTAIELE